MNAKRIGQWALVGVAGLLGFSLTLNAEPPETSPGGPAEKAKAAAAKPDDARVTVAEARERARLMHEIYSVSLEVMHHHYFRNDRPTLPARALEDVFDEIDERSKIKTRWIAVNTPAMSVDHEPETEFEKKAAAEIAAGKTQYDRVEDGYYRRAGVIPLGAGCVGCHTKLFRSPAKTPRFAGLVISIPVKDK
jgi:hypothetical protein